MNTKEMIEVMQAFICGDTLEIRSTNSTGLWLSFDTADEPNWDWDEFDYRIKPEEISLEDRVKAEWPRVYHIDIEIVKWHGVEFWGFKKGSKHWSTFEAKGMRGFRGFIYEFNDKLTIHMDCNYPTENYYHVNQPIAVIFSRGEG